jgi:hypothetical protein
MRQITGNKSTSVPRVLIVAAAALSLVAGLVTSPAALADHTVAPPGRSGSFAPLGGVVDRLGVARVIDRLDGAGGVDTGVLTGVLRAPAGTSLAGICVIAAGPAGFDRAVPAASGRFELAGLRPGRYRLKLTFCAVGAGSPAATGAGLSLLWPGLTGPVAVRAGQIIALPPAIVRPPGLSESRPAAGGGSISGLVTGTGRPIRSCVVAFIPSTGEGRVVRTSRTGRYRIAGLRRGRYEVQFAPKFDCADPGNWLTQTYPHVNSPLPPDQPSLVRVRAGKDTAGIDGNLKKGGEIAGVVRAKSGRSLRGICVYVYEQFPDGDFGTDQIRTGKSGRYADPGLYPDQYNVRFAPGCRNNGNYASQWWRGASAQGQASRLKITGQRVFTGIDATLLPGASIAGVVRAKDARANPLAGVCVSAFGADNNDYADATTGPTGHYRLGRLAPGRYSLFFDPTCSDPGESSFLPLTRRLSVKVGQVLTRFDAALMPASGISGVVTDAHGRPVGGACVLIDDQAGNAVKTKPDGSYTVRGVRPGTYTVQFFGGCGNVASLAPQFYDDQPAPVFAKPVRFVAGQITPEINPVMRPGAVIAGTITGSGGQRLSGVCASALAVNLPDESDEDGSLFGTFDRSMNGHYELSNLAPGSYELSLGGTFSFQDGCVGGKYAVQWFKSQHDSTVQDNISATAGVTTRVDAKISRSGSISGRVTGQTGHGLRSICVNLADPATKSLLSGDTGIFGFAETGRDGRYVLGGVTPGRYLVQFSDCAEVLRHPSQWYLGRSSIGRARLVTVRAGRVTAGIGATLGSGGSISGVVTGPAGQPLKNICLLASDSSHSLVGRLPRISGSRLVARLPAP